MRVWALADLHLPSSLGKAMDMFGPAWEGHREKIERNWRSLVGPDDIVLLPGDFSWAMRLPEAMDDFAFVAGLPGRHKILVRGNHDYWWASVAKLEAALGPAFTFIQNSALTVPPFTFAGTRGWELPSPEESEEVNAERRRLCEREVRRLTLSLEAALARRPERLIVLLHFPPLVRDGSPTIFTETIDRYAPEVVVYGHLHGEGRDEAFNGVRGGTRYVCASADAVDFAPVLIAES